MNAPEVLVREWFERARASGEARLPAERVLALELGLSRAALRKGLAALDADGLLVREVGRGTFLREIDRAPVEPNPAVSVRSAADVARDGAPRHMLAARWLLEPPMARLAAFEASAAQIDRLGACARRLEAAHDWQTYDTADSNFHRAIAEATGNPVMLHLFDALSGATRAMNWGRLAERPTFRDDIVRIIAREHANIVDAISSRDGERAETTLRRHLRTERETIMEYWFTESRNQ